ncbi:ribose-5-phosphate isomerase [Candidatus Saccharibacteria bacterium]|nr:MAG: ribose-5-phosphate isomerase [Candidatus Saccharibacteria bacterium]
MNIAITTDHAGYEQLQELQVWLQSMGHTCVNFGPTHFDKDDDYPDFMFPAAQAVSRGAFERGIIMGGSGQGEAIAANRFKNVRCALFYAPATAKVAIDAEGRTSDDPYEIVRLSRQHNNANMLSLSGRFLDIDQMKQAIQIWLDTPFEGEARHARRIEKLSSKGSDK